MSDTMKPKRAHAKSSAPRSRPPTRDPRAEGSIAPRRPQSRPRLEVLPARIANLEAELRRLKEARATDADELARMLVRIAAAERARAMAEERADGLATRVRELEALRDEVRRGAEAMDLATRRAELAERSAADGAEALERTRVEREADRLRTTELEAKLARMRREHGDELAALRSARADADGQLARALDEERAALVQVRQRATKAEESLAEACRRLEQATSLIEQVERREEMAASLRTRTLERTRQVLRGDACETQAGGDVAELETLGEEEIDDSDANLSE